MFPVFSLLEFIVGCTYVFWQHSIGSEDWNCSYITSLRRSTSTNSPEKIQYGIFEPCTGLIRDWSKYNSTLSQSIRKLMHIPRVLTRESILLFVLVIFNNKIMHELLTCTRHVSCRRDRFLYYRCTSFFCCSINSHFYQLQWDRQRNE